MGLLDTKPEEPHSKRLRYAVSAVALALLLAFGLWYLLRFSAEEHTVEHFMEAVVGGNFQQAYQIWKPHGSSYTYQDFLGDFGAKGYYGPIQSYRIESAASPKNSNAVSIVVEISPFRPFPANSDPKSGRNKEIMLWVDRSDQSLSFPP
jgi:hypothetical protein